MSHCQKILLADRAVLRVSGPDAAKFLQGLVTSNVTGVGEGSAAYAALLTPQGKILFDFFIAPEPQGGFLIDCVGPQKDDILKRLTMYRLRAAVELAQAPELAVAALLGACPSPQDAIVYPDPRLAALGQRAILTQAQFDGLDAEPAGQSDYDAHRIAAGVPQGGADFAYGDAYPHEALLDQLNGVDFGKGCYVGQEVVSRMEHRGTGARKRVVPVVAQAALPQSGADIAAGDVILGRLGSVRGNRGLAMLRLDRAETALAQGQSLTAEGVTLTLQQPGWARFSVPSAGA